MHSLAVKHRGMLTSMNQNRARMQTSGGHSLSVKCGVSNRLEYGKKERDTHSLLNAEAGQLRTKKEGKQV